jgi:helix-turn-helix protein
MVAVGKISAYENGEMDHEEVVELFQELIDTGMLYILQGSYGRTAQALIEQGFCTNG